MTDNAPGTDLARMVQGGQAVIRIENESMQQLAIQRPRPGIPDIIKAATEELESVPEFAETAYYVLPFKEKADDPSAKVVNIEGLSIKAAQALRRHFRNIQSATRTVDETERHVVVQARAIDLETNTGAAKEKEVSKFGYNRKTKQEFPLRPDRLQMAVDAAKSKAERNAILALLPEAIKITYFRKAKEIAGKKLGASDGKKALPIETRRTLALAKFEELGVKPEQLLAHLKVKAQNEITDEQIGELVGIYNSIADSELTIEDVFGVKAKEEAPVAGEALLDGMLRSNEPVPADGATAVVNGHHEVTEEDKRAAADAIDRQQMEAEYNTKMKALTPRWPDKLTEAERKFVEQVIPACWGVPQLDFQAMQKQVLGAGLQKFFTLADGILARRAKR